MVEDATKQTEPRARCGPGGTDITPGPEDTLNDLLP